MENSFLSEFKEREYFNQCTNSEELEQLMSKKKIKTRHILEYKYDAVVHLNYDPNLKMVVFDHLIPLNGSDADSEMVPDGSYEGFKYKGGQWHYVEKIFNQKLKDGQAPIN